MRQLMFCQLVTFTLLFAIVPWTKAHDLYYVAAVNESSSLLESCPSNATCHDINYYCAQISAANATWTPLTDVTFYFLPGTHVLENNCDVENAVNLSFQGGGQVKYNENEASWQSDVIIRFGGVFSAWRIVSSQYITIDGISVITQPGRSNFNITKSTAIMINNTHVNSTATKERVTTATGSHGLVLYDCENVSISYSSFALMGDSGLFVEYDENQNMASNYMNLHHTNFSYNQLAGLTIFGGVENYFPVNFKLTDLLFTANTHRSMSFLMLHCVGKITMEGIESSGSITGLYFENTLPCRNMPPSVHVKNSIFERSRRFGIKMLIAPNSGTVSFENITIQDIVGYQATGISIIQRPYQRLGTTPNQFLLSNMTIERIHPRNYSLSTSQHAIGLSIIQKMTISDVNIKNNIGNGLSMEQTIANLAGNITFYNNSALDGGAIKLQSRSELVPSQYLNMNFEANKAESYGGAISIEQDRVFFSPDSVFQNVTLVFIDNTAGQAGSAIYGDLEACFTQQGCESSFLINGQGGFDAALDCRQSIISSDEYQVYFCNENCLGSSTHELDVIPGKPFTFEMSVVGELNGTTPALVRLISSDSNSSATIEVPSGPTCAKGALMLNLARPTNLVNFSIFVSDPTVNDYHKNPAWLAVHVLPCPVGFELVNGRCQCDQVLTGLGLTCDILSTSWQKTASTWIAPSETNDSNCIYFAESCSFDYCNQSITNFSIGQPDFQCMENRHGTLCGGCKDEYSLLLGSNKCANCTSTDSAWRVPVVLLGSAIAGIGLVVLLVGLDLTVSKGTVNGLIFFANIVKLYEASFPLGQNTVIGVIISWVNLDLGIETCFYQGMDACGKVGLQFVFPFYVIALAILFIVLGSADQWRIFQLTRLGCIISPISRKTTALLGNRAVSVIATLFLLSYTKLIRTVISIFSRASIQCCDPSTDSCHHSYTSWYLDGTIRYFTGCHSVMVIIACILSLVIVLFTTFLVMFPLVAENRLQACECRGTWRLKLQPWFDAYGGPYKERYRFWVGLLIVVRCVMALVVALAPSNSARLTALAWVSLAFIMVSAFLQVYKSRILNVLEVCYFAGLLMLAYLGDSDFSTSDTVGIYVVISLSLLVGVCVTLHGLHIYFSVLSNRYNTYLTKMQSCTNCQERKKMYTFNTELQFETRGSASSMCQLDTSGVSITVVTTEDNEFPEPSGTEDNGYCEPRLTEDNGYREPQLAEDNL